MVIDSKARKILKSFPEDVQKYFRAIDKKCQKHGIKFRIGGGKTVNFGHGRCGGYFHEENKELVVSIGKSLQGALSLMIHETCHLEQALKKTKAWSNRSTMNGHTRFFNYLAGQKIYKLDHAINSVISIELECERMAVKEIKRKWTHIINLDSYVKQSNIYLFSHYFMAKTRKWPKKSMFDKKIMAHSPDKLLRSYKHCPWRLMLAFERYL